MPWTGFVVVVVVTGVLEFDDPEPDVPGTTLPSPTACVSPLTPLAAPLTVVVSRAAPLPPPSRHRRSG